MHIIRIAHSRTNTEPEGKVTLCPQARNRQIPSVPPPYIRPRLRLESAAMGLCVYIPPLASIFGALFRVTLASTEFSRLASLHSVRNSASHGGRWSTGQLTMARRRWRRKHSLWPYAAAYHRFCLSGGRREAGGQHWRRRAARTAVTVRYLRRRRPQGSRGAGAALWQPVPPVAWSQAVGRCWPAPGLLSGCGSGPCCGHGN